MEKPEFKLRQKLLKDIAQKYRWSFIDIDTNTFRVSYVDESEDFRADVYLSKLTVCLAKRRSNPKFLKKRTWKQIDKIFGNPRTAK